MALSPRQAVGYCRGMSVKRKPALSLRMKLHLLLDEAVLLAREARGLVRAVRENRGPDLYGPRGTEIRLEPVRQDRDFFVPEGREPPFTLSR